MAQAKEYVYIYPPSERNAVGDPVTAGTDMFGDPIEGATSEPAAPVDADADGVPDGWSAKVYSLVWPRSAADNSSREITTAAQNTVIVGLTALMPRGTVIDPRSTVWARGARYEVEGEPGDYKSRGLMVALKRVRG